MMLSDKHLIMFGQAVQEACRWLPRQALRPFRFRVLQRIFLPDPQPTEATRPARHTARALALALVCLVVCIGLLGRMVHTSLARGMDGGLYEVVEDAAHAIAVAVSDLRFGLNKGYVGYTAIFNELEKGGFTSKEPLVNALGLVRPQQLRDRALLNRTLEAALNTPVPRDVGFGDRSLLSMGYAELGLVDYFKLAFRLFGYKVESAFYLYFLLLGLSVASLILAFWRDPIILAIPILFLAAGNIILATTFFDAISSQTVANPRFLSTLGILPGLHILMLMLGARRATIVQVVLACVQALIFEFALSIRAALFWCVILVAVVGLVQVAVLVARSYRGRQFLRASLVEWSGELAALRLWPALILVVGIWTYQSAIAVKMHPSYELDDFLPAHLRYHNAFMGLTANPDWEARFGAKYHHATNDTLGFLAGALYLIDNYDVPESYYVSPLYGGPKMRLDDRMVEKAYIQFITQHPWFTVEAHFYKVREIESRLGRMIASAHPKGIVLLIAISGIIVAALFCAVSLNGAATSAASTTDALRLVIVGTLAALFSFIPYVYAIYYDQVLGDGLWMTLFAILLLCCGGLVAVAAGSAMLLRRRAGVPAAPPQPDPEVTTRDATVQSPTTYVRLIGSMALSAAVAWSAVTYFNHGAPKANSSPRPAPSFFNLPPPAAAPVPH